jgi:transcriptional regulator with XRE-family HTH domain
MSSLGSYLKSAREARGLDLRDAAQQTRISIGYLKAIEDEDFSKLPGAVFVKGFLKNYARFLQLPEDEVMQRFGEIGTPQPTAAPTAASPKDERQKHAVAAAPTPESRPERTSRLGLEPFLWAGSILVGLVLFILTALPGKDHRREQSETSVSTVTATTHPQSAATSTGKPEKLYLEIVALEDVWVQDRRQPAEEGGLEKRRDRYLERRRTVPAELQQHRRGQAHPERKRTDGERTEERGCPGPDRDRGGHRISKSRVRTAESEKTEALDAAHNDRAAAEAPGTGAAGAVCSADAVGICTRTDRSCPGTIDAIRTDHASSA